MGSGFMQRAKIKKENKTKLHDNIDKREYEIW